ncbi:MAG: hypothetical protein ACR2OC_01750 [Solirubrobacterales bacterium]
MENEARRRADEITAQADLRAAESERMASARAEALIIEAKAERDRIWEQIRIGVGRATRQVGDLLRIREELRFDLREALQDSGRALEQLEEGGGDVVESPAPPAWLPSGGGSPASTRGSGAAISGHAAELPGAPAPTEPHPPRSRSPLSPGPRVAPKPPVVTTRASLAALKAGPFESFLAVMRFERELAALARVDAVYVRRFSNQEVDVEVASNDEAGLAEAIRNMPAVNSVEAKDGLILVRLQGEESASQ